jgi:hypothetical protein
MLKNISSKIAALVAFSAVSLSVSAQTSYQDTNLTVTGAGVQSGVAYFQTSPAPSGSCLYNTLYIGSVNGNAGNAAAYATVLAALSNGQQITIVQYTNTSGTCSVGLVQTGP